MKLIECVPNFSTADPQVVDAILAKIRAQPDVYLLDSTFDDYYNRLVVSIVGSEDAVVQAVLHAAQEAIKHIDMNKHQGQHPRLGAVDVVPFIPIRDATMDDCVQAAKAFGRQLAQEHGVPVYLYGVAAATPQRGDLDWIREGEYEALATMIQRPERKPDFGPARAHQTAGATITGARKVMAGFNVNLDTPDLTIAKKIAKALHAKKGGFTTVKAIGVQIPQQGRTQIGMSIADYEKTPLYRIFEVIRFEAQRYNVTIHSAEFCGMAPLQTLLDIAAYHLKIDNLTPDKVLEIAVQTAIDKGPDRG